MSGGPAERVVGLPWERDRYWLPSGADAAVRVERGPSAHSLLGEYIDYALDARAHAWQLDLSQSTVPWLGDHQIFESSVVSVAVSVEMLLAALAARSDEPAMLEQLRLEHPLVIPERGGRTIQVALQETHGSHRGTLGVFSRGPGEQEWIPHVEGRFLRRAANTLESGPSLDALRAQFSGAEHDVEAFYRRQSQRGLDFGPAFQSVRQLWVAKREVLAHVVLPEAASYGREAFCAHPVLLDGALQAILAAVPDTETFLTAGIDRMLVLPSKLPTSLWSHVKVGETASSGVDALVVFYSDDGEVVARVEGLRLLRVEQGARSASERGADLPSAEHETGLAARLRRESPGSARRARFEGMVRERLGGVLGIEPGRIDARRPLQAMGLTSLMAVELRHHLGALIDARLPATLAWNYPTLEALLGYLDSRLPISLDHDGDGDEAVDAAPAEPCADSISRASIGPESEQEAGLDAELLEELERVDALLASI